MGKREDILDATVRLLGKKGVHKLSFEGVANEAGLSRQLIRYYFADVESLMLELCSEQTNTSCEMISSGAENRVGADRLQAFLDFFFDLLDGKISPSTVQTCDAFVAYSVASEAMRAQMAEAYSRLNKVIGQELQAACPDLEAWACDQFSHSLTSMMHSNWRFVSKMHPNQEHSRLTRAAFERMVEACRSRSAAATLGEPRLARA